MWYTRNRLKLVILAEHCPSILHSPKLSFVWPWTAALMSCPPTPLSFRPGHWWGTPHLDVLVHEWIQLCGPKSDDFGIWGTNTQDQGDSDSVPWRYGKRAAGPGQLLGMCMVYRRGRNQKKLIYNTCGRYYDIYMHIRFASNHARPYPMHLVSAVSVR